MPFRSKAQQGFFHSPAAAKVGITKADVAHWDAASKGEKNLPEHAVPISSHRVAHGAKVKKAHG